MESQTVHSQYVIMLQAAEHGIEMYMYLLGNGLFVMLEFQYMQSHKHDQH